MSTKKWPFKNINLFRPDGHPHGLLARTLSALERGAATLKTGRRKSQTMDEIYQSVQARQAST